MPPFTLNQAAREAKKSKATLLDAIRAGRLSASKDEAGRYQIDPAELFRVYPPTGSEPVSKTDTDPPPTPLPTPMETSGLQGQIDVLRELVRQIEAERDDLRRRLDDEVEDRRQNAAEIRRLTFMLTDQRQPQAEALQSRPAPPGVRLPFWFALVAVSVAAASWYLWPWVMGNH